MRVLIADRNSRLLESISRTFAQQFRIQTATTCEGCSALLLQGERQKFLAEDWPRVSATIQRLGLTTEELLEAANGKPSNDEKKEPKS